MTLSIRECFVSRYGPENGFLVEFDFSQLEICALAEVSGDTVLIDELNRGEDIHRLNAAMWIGKRPDAVTTDERKKAKVMTFQLQYGAGPKKMAESLGIAAYAAREFINAFYTKYTGIKHYHDTLESTKNIATLSALKQINPELETMIVAPTPTGRMYSIPFREQTKGGGGWYYSSTELKNYPIQGFGTADIVPVVLNLVYDAMQDVYALTPTETPPLINTVHDSIMFDCMVDELVKLFAVVEIAFRRFPAKFKELFDYELKVVYNYDVKVGKNWFEKDMDKFTRAEVQSLIKDKFGV